MTGNKYIVTSKSTGNSVSFEYDLEGLLVAFRIEVETYTREEHSKMMNNVLIYEKDMERFQKNPKIEVKMVPADLSFDNFWNCYGEAYGEKVGKKKMTENAWTKLSAVDKVLALGNIKKYKFAQARRGHEMAYPSTYLNQRIFEN